MEKFNNLSFHESTVITFEGKDGEFVTLLEDVSHNDEVENILITVKNVSKMTKDGVIKNELGMFFNDGEVLSLELDEEKLFILIEWNDFPTIKSQTVAYEIFGNFIQFNKV